MMAQLLSEKRVEIIQAVCYNKNNSSIILCDHDSGF